MVSQSEAVKRAQTHDFDVQNPNTFEWLTSSEHMPDKRNFESF